MNHYWFLNNTADDPRESFIVSLLEALPPEGSILTYSSYEKQMITRLAQAFPGYQGRLLALLDREVDLLKLIRDNYYHPEFHG